MGYLSNRIEKLEKNGNGEPCAECGDDPRPGEISYEITWSAGEHDENEYCGTCGRPTVIVVTWGDEPDRRPWWRRWQG